MASCSRTHVPIQTQGCCTLFRDRGDIRTHEAQAVFPHLLCIAKFAAFGAFHSVKFWCFGSAWQWVTKRKPCDTWRMDWLGGEANLGIGQVQAQSLESHFNFEETYYDMVPRILETIERRRGRVLQEDKQAVLLLRYISRFQPKSPIFFFPWKLHCRKPLAERNFCRLTWSLIMVEKLSDSARCRFVEM
jgi:hypothetical protein